MHLQMDIVYTGDADVDMQVEKFFWPDADLSGSVTEDGADVVTELLFTSARYQDNGAGEGKVKKSEFDWKVRQTAPNTWEIKRFALKWDSELQLFAQDGKITGEFIRKGPAINWTINGTYDNQGNVKIRIDAPFTMGITMSGKITPR